MTVNLKNLSEKARVLKSLYDSTQSELVRTGQLTPELNNRYLDCINKSSELIKFMDDMNPFEANRYKEDLKNTYWISAEVLVRTVGLHNNRQGFENNEKSVLYTAIAHLQKVINIEPFNPGAKELYKLVFIYLTLYNANAEENIKLLTTVLAVDPCDYQLQYNLGFMYHRVNNLENSLHHYKMAVSLIDLQLQLNDLSNKKEKDKTAVKTVLTQFKVKCLNGLGGIYFTIQDRELANYYFFEALKMMPNDPDINNQVGVVFTELRFTDKAIMHYKRGIENVDKAHISVDRDMLIASMYMNMGLAYCYEINYPEAINCYNKALSYKPRLSLAYQNKLLDLNYISHLIERPMYITKLHKAINKIYPVVVNDYRESLPNYQVKKVLSRDQMLNTKTKINIGFVSGDFICHPVSYFLSSILKHLNYNLFNVYCYSLKVVQLKEMYPNCNWRVVKGTSPEQLKAKIGEDSIDILFDLSSQTGDNRLDTFALKPAPIQISYCGYPNTSGLSNMDYHIIDRYTDSDGVTPGPGGVVRPSTQKYYSEKLIFMDRCFLTYTPSIGMENIPALPEIQPCIKNGYLTVGSFNRYNKINDSVVEVWEQVLEACPNVRFVIKTKEFLTESLKNQFIKTWKNKKLLSRIEILPYSDLYTQHLVDYHLMDVALDTFPYSGTTTSCEALLLGVPVLTLFDSKRQYHSQNVTSSLMINSGKPDYVVYSKEEYVKKIKELSENLGTLKNLKRETRKGFLEGPICNYREFVNEFETKMIETYKNHAAFGVKN
jgi:predicted O-linked N-acetylglucosamine transferase (SPINDLY family)